MAIYIATIGDPTNWQPSDYTIKDENMQEEKIEEAYTTLFTYENASKIILIVNDSVIYPRGRQQNHPALVCYDSEVTSLHYTKYSELLSTVKKYIECVMNKFKDDLKNRVMNKFKDDENKRNEILKKIDNIFQKINEKDIDIIVIPAIGMFKKDNDATTFGKIVFNKIVLPSARYYPNLVEVLLAYSLYEMLKSTKEKEVVLDITHGINYLPTLAFNTIYKLISLLGLKFTVINFVQVNSRDNDKIKIFSRVDIVSTVNKRFRFHIDQINEDEIDNKLNKSVIKALKYNAPLALIYLCKLRGQGVSDYYSQFVNATSISKISDKEDEILIDKEKIKWIEKVDEVWADIIADFVCEKVNDIAGKYSCDEGYYKIEILNKLAEEVFSRFSSISENIIQNEANNIYTVVNEGIKEGEEKMYYELLKFEGTPSDPERIKRNYIAHAGLLKEILKVKKTNEGKICIKYADMFKDVLSAVYAEDIAKSMYDVM